MLRGQINNTNIKKQGDERKKEKMDEIVNYMDDYNLKYDDELKETADEIIAKTGKLDKPSSELKPKSKEASQLSSRPRIYNI